MGDGYIYLLTTYFQTQPYEEIYSRVQHDEDVQIPTYRPVFNPFCMLIIKGSTHIWRQLIPRNVIQQFMNRTQCFNLQKMQVEFFNSPKVI